MISRRLIRIKILQVLYAYFKAGEDDQSVVNSEKELNYSIQKSFELYHSIFLLLTDLHAYALKKMEQAKKKLRATEQDLNPNKRFVDNAILALLVENNDLNNFVENQKISWSQHPELIKRLYNNLQESELYAQYMASANHSFRADKEFIIKYISTEVIENELFHQTLEDKSIYWNDDANFVAGMVVKTISKMKRDSNENYHLMTLYKNSDDALFARQLLRKSILNFEKNREIIEKHTKNWDFDRISDIDVLILVMGISEAMGFDSIPIKVTLNEYIEIGKYYGTQKSNAFINGILDQIFKDLKAENRIFKVGRGLA